MQELPPPKELLLNAPLYKKFARDDSNIGQLRDYISPLDVYCTDCHSLSVFSREDETPSQAMAKVVLDGVPIWDRAFRPYTFSMLFKCSRDQQHKLHFIFRVDENSITKIGEFPSRIDRLYPELHKYETLLGSYYDEYKSALMLHSHGVGIGSFTYLRRVFERVIRDVATRKYNTDSSWTYEEWRKGKRFYDVLNDLASELPDFLAGNTVLYAILSKGIHELGDEECLEVFDVVKAAIEQILEDTIAQNEKAQRRERITQQIQQLPSKLS